MNAVHDGTESYSPLERRLLEAFDELWSGYVDPREALVDGDGSPWLEIAASAGGGRAASVPFRTEAEQAAIRARCRALAAANEFAINAHENRVSYLVGAGHAYRAVPRLGQSPSAELLVETQAVVEQFVRENRWHGRQQEIVRRRDRDGEVFLRFFVDLDGTTRVRFVEPDQVRTPAELVGTPSASFGIHTDPDDVETVRHYYVDGQPVDAAEIQHRKANVDANVKRGLPLFYPVQKNLRRAEKLLRNMSVVAEIQSAIALIRKHRGATRTAVQQFVASQADAQATSPATGRATNYLRYAPGTILDSHGGIDYDFPAQALDAGRYVAVLQAELRAIASRLVMPEFMLTSDASNANYSSTLVAEGPVVKLFQRLQAELIEEDQEVFRRVLAAAVRAGRLPAEALATIEIHAEPPSLAVRNLREEADIAQIEHAAGILSPQTWSQRRGLDYQREQAALAAHAAAGRKD